MSFVRSTLALALVAAFAVTAVAQRLEPNSFIRKLTPTHASFMEHVRTDSVVMDRYMRHFGMSRQQVLDYFGSLRLARLENGGPMLQYNVPEATGELRHRVLNLRTGTPVFVDASGTPIMKVSCGNPLVRGTEEQMSVFEPEAIGDDTLALRPMEILDEGDGEMMFVSMPIEPIPTEQSAQLFSLPPTATLPPAAVAALGGGSAGISLAPVAAIGAAGALVGLVGAEGDTATVSFDPVPEPGTMLVLGGASALMLARRRRKQAAN